MKTVNTHLYIHIKTVLSMLDWKNNVVSVEICGFSGTSGKHWNIQLCTSANENVPFNFNSLYGLENEGFMLCGDCVLWEE